MGDKADNGPQAAARILIVEDEGIIAFCLKDTLTELGYDVVGSVPSGEEAIQEAGEKLPDLVLMDVQLQSDMSGIEAAAQIHAQFGIPVVYMTGYAKDTLLQQIKATGSYHLDKLARDEELYATIEKALR